jgi:hypothetical protein
MKTPPSPHFSCVPLDAVFNSRRDELSEELRTPGAFSDFHGAQTVRGIPFALGSVEGANVVLLDSEPVSVDLGGAKANHVLVIHAVENAPAGRSLRFTGDKTRGRLGGPVSDYWLEYEDGSRTSTPILRGFAIQQPRMAIADGLSLSFSWVCVPAVDDLVWPSADEALAMGLSPPGLAPTRSLPAKVRAFESDPPGVLWIGSVTNTRSDVPLRALTCWPREERSTIYAVTLSSVEEHPLRPGTRRKAKVRLPDATTLNAINEVDQTDIGIDLGVVISARAALDYDHDRWLSQEPVVQPMRSPDEVIVEYAAHPQARLHIGGAVYELDGGERSPLDVAPAERPVRLRFVELASRDAVAVRLHLHGEAGEYLPPRGHHRKVNRVWHQDTSAELASGANEYAYVDGECIVDLPLGTIYVEISRGYEISPIRTTVDVDPGTEELVFELERVLRWRERGWVTADTHVHFLSPQTALLEGQAEAVNVVNVLASQWGELVTNVGDFDGKTTVGADQDGVGEFLVRVGSENRMPVLGHISLLGYKGELIHPLCSGGPGESAFGDSLEVTMAEWAQRCIDQGGLVVLPHMQALQIEHAADIVLGVVNAFELMHANPLDPNPNPFCPEALSPYGLADWYRYQNLGYQIPLTGGSDKMSADMLLGGIRGYAHLGTSDLTYDNWMDAVRAGNTFVTVGPLVEVRVEGVAPGKQVHLPRGGGTVDVEWLVESLHVPVQAIEVVVGGVIADSTTGDGRFSLRGTAAVAVSRSTWIAVRVRGSLHGRPDDIAAHSSAVQVILEGMELFDEADSTAVLEQIQGAIAYVDTIAPRPDARRFNALRATLESAYNRLHQRMHAAGVYHRHPLHDPAEPHDH